MFTQIFITPKDILLSQKFYAILNRARNKGRDFSDVIFLLSRVDKPNYDYLQAKLDISNAADSKKSILEKCGKINMQEMARDVVPFLFNPGDIKKILYFPEY